MIEEDKDLLKSDKGGLDSSQEIKRVTGMYEDWFLDYASYVILERAVPDLFDGFKPVQRRVMQSMKDLDDGRYNKVANLVGHTMQYHPHGDTSISDAMIQLGQKELLIDTQGNWGNILTGDSAAAPRYIEARLSKFAIEVLFNPKITQWQTSYDGRKKEPIHLPVKFPLLLVQGAEGIAVGLSTKILPHNFNELVDASIDYLKGKEVKILPDFLTGGIADFSNYNDGKRGGKVRVRSKLKALDSKTLIITEVPYGITTGSLIDSMLKANEKGKIKIKRIEDNTASQVEILIHLPPGVSPDKTIDALYAFTNCETSISPICCIISNDKPLFLGVSELLKKSTDYTVSLLKAELQVQLEELEQQWHFSCLEIIFIENRIYRLIEEQNTWEGIIETIDIALKPYIKNLKRPITEQDIVKLTEIKIKRISKFDIDKSKLNIKALEDKIIEINRDLSNLIDFAVGYFKNLKDKYGKERKRKTQITLFDDIVATKVVMRNKKLYVNREEGFIGTALKKDEFVSDCADIDNVIIFKDNGQMLVTKVTSKVFVGKGIIYVAIFKKDDKRTIYNMVYLNGLSGITYTKRFNVTSITRDKVYDLIPKNKKSIVYYFTCNPNGEAETVTIFLRKVKGLKKLKWDIDFSELLIKGRSSRGNLVTKCEVKKIEFKHSGKSTLKPRKIWYDKTVKRLNVDSRGRLLGEFKAENKILIITKRATIKAITPDLNCHFESDMIILEKWEPTKPISVLYYEGEKQKYYIKRFLLETPGKEELFISEHPQSKLIIVSTDYRPVGEVFFSKNSLEKQKIKFEDFIAIKGIKAIGNQFSTEKIKNANLLEPLPYSKVDKGSSEYLIDNNKTKKLNKGKQMSLF